MGRLHKNPEQPGTPAWVCCICGIPERVGCKHAGNTEYIRETDYRSVEKMVEEQKIISNAGRRNKPK